MSRSVGITKWFSNRKGFGFVAPTSENSPTKDEIFVHQSAIKSEGYRSLAEGMEIEFDVEMDEGSGKYKAVNVTAVGGGAVQPPPKKKRDKKPKKADGEEGEASPKKSKEPAKPKEPAFYEDLSSDIQDTLKSKGFDLVSKTTLDVALGDYRIKLGQGGYAGLVEASGMVGEGTYTCDDKGVVAFDWARSIVVKDGAWQVNDAKKLMPTLDLLQADAKPVTVGETIVDLWGDQPDPKETFEKNGFLMRRIVLTRAPGGGRRRPPSKKK